MIQELGTGGAERILISAYRGAREAGHEVFVAAAPTSMMREPTTELLRRYGLEPRRLPEGLEGNWSAMASAKAARVLGYRAEHQWQQYLTDAGEPRAEYSGA